MSHFQDILDKRIDEVEPPKLLPDGTYVGIIDKDFEPITSQQGNDGAAFSIRLVKPFRGVDDAALSEAGGCANRVLTHRIYVTEQSDHFLRQFLEHLGIDTSVSFRQGLSEVRGKQLLVQVGQTLTKSTDPRMINIVKQTARV